MPLLPWFGITGDFGFAQKSYSASDSVLGVSASGSATARLFTYGGGPQLTFRGRNVEPFGRFLLGGATANGSASDTVSGFGVSASGSTSATTTAFFIAPGGGADFRLHKNMWLRAGIDYLHADKQGVSVDAVRAFGGIQFRFGGKSPSDTIPPSPKTTRDQNLAKQTSMPTRASIGIDQPISIPSLEISVKRGESGAEIVEASPASGLHVGDVIIMVDGKRVHDPAELSTELQSRKPGDQIHLGYLFRASVGQYQSEAVITLK